MNNFEAHNDDNISRSSLFLKIFSFMCFTNTVMRLLQMLYIPGFGGQYDDFTGMWFRQNGISIMSSSVTAAGGLIGGAVAGYVIPRLKIAWDQKFSKYFRVTRKTTHYQYQLVYVSPEYMLEKEYAKFLNIIFFALTFGFSMPILFIGTLITLIATFYQAKVFSK